jgi:hypothetical protein
MDIKGLIRHRPGLYRFLMNGVEKFNAFRWKLAARGFCGGTEGLIAREYKKNTGETLRIPPVSYTEKIQFAKIYESTPLKGELSDKYSVRKWVASKIGEQYLIPLLGAWEKYEEINFDELPDQFVLKTSQSSGTNVIVLDKRKIDHCALRKKFNFWVKQNWAFAGKGFEMHYRYIHPRIIAEKYVTDSNGELNDYKFLCFNGKPCYVWVDIGRSTDHRRNVYDMDWNLQSWRQYTYKNSDQPIPKPEHFDDMVELVEVLCEGFDHVRVDLYYVDGSIYFGEMTFTNGKGYELIIPPEANDMLGALWTQNIEK